MSTDNAELVRWEYQILHAAVRGKMNDLGCEGWEAFAVSGTNVYFKRPVTAALKDGLDCICGEINARHCPVHNDGSITERTDG